MLDFSLPEMTQMADDGFVVAGSRIHCRVSRISFHRDFWSPVQGPARVETPAKRHPQFHSDDRVQHETGSKRTCDTEMVSIVDLGESNRTELISCSWDLGGQPRFRPMWERYCRGVNAIVYVCACVSLLLDVILTKSDQIHRGRR